MSTDIPEKLLVSHLVGKVDKLEKALKKAHEEIDRLKSRNSRNSSKPPSQDFKSKGKDEDTPKNKGGAQPGHNAHQKALLSEDKVQSTVECKCQHCPACGSDNLQERPPGRIFQHLDLEDGKIRAVNYVRHRYYCGSCQKYFSASLPAHLDLSPIGNNLRAAICTLTARFHLSKRDAAALIGDFFQLSVSVGLICKVERQMAQALKPVHERIREAILTEDQAVNADETSWRHDNRNVWLWEICNSQLTYFHLDFHRSRAARDRLFGRNFCKILITDRYAVYSDLGTCHQYCLAHIMRNFREFAERKSIVRVIGKALLLELKAVFRHWHLYKSGDISRNQLNARCAYRRRNIQALLQDGVFYENQRLSRFCWKLLGGFDAMWTFLRVDGVEPTNNQAERDLRPMVLWR